MPTKPDAKQPGLWPAVVADPDAPQSVTARTVIAEWIERCAKRPPNRVVARVGKYVAEMLGEGIDPDDIRRGMATWMRKGLDPAVLPSVVNETMNRTNSARGLVEHRGHLLRPDTVANIQLIERIAAMEAAEHRDAIEGSA